MNVVPRHWTLTDDEELRWIPAPPGHLVLECEVVQPPSSKGRTVYVHFDPDDVTLLVKQARAAAIASRSKTLTESHANPSQEHTTDGQSRLPST